MTVLGASRTSDADIRTHLGIDEGESWNPRVLTEGLSRLLARGLYRDAAAWVTREPEGLHLWIRVEEKPVLAGVEIEGAKKVGKDDLREQITLAAGSLWDEAAAQEDRAAIRRKLRDEGYHRAEVAGETESRPDGKLFLRYRITEGDKTRVRAIRFAGNVHLPADALSEVMETKPRKWHGGGDFDQEKFAADLEAIVAEFGARGYLDARVVRHDLQYDDEGGLTIVIEVAEGPRYYAGEVKIEGNDRVPDAEVLGAIRLQRGGLFSEREFDATVEALYEVYGERGHVYAGIAPQRTARGDTVDVTFQIEEGEPAYVGRIDITGNLSTREKVVRRELLLVPGDIFRRSALVRSHREVFSLGFFEDVQVKTDVSPEGSDINLVFDVKERETGQFLAGASYSGEFGLVGSLEMAKTNFRGTGQSASVKWEFGRFGQVELSFTEPWFRGTPTSVGVDLFDTRLRRESYTEKSRGAALRVGRPLPWLDYTRAFVRYEWDNWKVAAETEGVSAATLLTRTLRFAGRGTSSSIEGTLLRNSTDNPFFPTRGMVTRLSSEYSGGWLGGDTGFQRHIVDQQLLLPLWRSLVLSVGARSGAISPYSGGQIPVFEKFRLGGIGPNGIRGYPDLDVVPRGNDPAEGGRAMLITRAECRFPVNGPQLSGLGFFDAGDVWNSPSGLAPTSLRRGAGLGFRVQVPGIGTLGFDYGYGFDRGPELGGPGWELHFNIGSASGF